MDPDKRRLDQYEPRYIRRRVRENTDVAKIECKPIINTEQLFKYDKRTLKRAHLKNHPDWL